MNDKTIRFLEKKFPFGSTFTYMGQKMTVLSHFGYTDDNEMDGEGHYPKITATYADLNGVIREIALAGAELKLMLEQNK